MYVSIWKSDDGVFETFGNKIGAHSDGAPMVDKTYTVRYRKPFPEWIEANYSSYQNFLTLKAQDKERILLKYKHGLESDYVNIGLDISERRIMKDLVRPEDIAEGSYYASRKDFENYCYEVKKEIGLVPTAEQHRTQDMVKRVFGPDS